MSSIRKYRKYRNVTVQTLLLSGSGSRRSSWFAACRTTLLLSRQSRAAPLEVFALNSRRSSTANRTVSRQHGLTFVITCCPASSLLTIKNFIATCWLRSNSDRAKTSLLITGGIAKRLQRLTLETAMQTRSANWSGCTGVACATIRRLGSWWGPTGRTLSKKPLRKCRS